MTVRKVTPTGTSQEERVALLEDLVTGLGGTSSDAGLEITVETSVNVSKADSKALSNSVLISSLDSRLTSAGL